MCQLVYDHLYFLLVVTYVACGLLKLDFPFTSMLVASWQIEIKELDDFAQAAFHGYKSLNRIQSRIYQTTYNTNENILVRDNYRSSIVIIQLYWSFLYL